MDECGRVPNQFLQRVTQLDSSKARLDRVPDHVLRLTNVRAMFTRLVRKTSRKKEEVLLLLQKKKKKKKKTKKKKREKKKKKTREREKKKKKKREKKKKKKRERRRGRRGRRRRRGRGEGKQATVGRRRNLARLNLTEAHCIVDETGNRGGATHTG